MIGAQAEGVQAASSPSGRPRYDAIKLRTPLFGKLHRLICVSRFCRTLSTLLISGVPIINAMGIVNKVIGNVVLADTIEKATVNIREGQSIAMPLRQSGEFPPLVTHMIAIGEKTGELERMLTSVAESYDDQVEQAIEGMTSLLGPLLILAMGGSVFMIALAMLLPMTQLSKMISY